MVNSISSRTGNAFVDHGLCCIASLSKVNSLSDLKKSDFEKVLIENNIPLINKSLKSYTMVFGTNGPLYQNAYKGKNEELYKEFLKELVTHIGVEGDQICEICGAKHDFNMDESWKKILEKTGFKKNDKKIKEAGRDFFPLIGTAGSGAHALSCASKLPNLCPKCLYAVQFIPMSTMLLKGNLTCIESTSEQMMGLLINKNVEENLNRVDLESTEIYGKKDSTKQIFSNFLNILKFVNEIYENEVIYYWIFSNSGDSPRCDILEIPNNLIKLLWNLAHENESIKNEFLSLVEKDKGRLLDSISNNEDIIELYPYKKSAGVSVTLYEYYQKNIVGRSETALNFAKNVAKELLDATPEKDVEKLKKSDIFYKFEYQNAVKKTIFQMLLDGKATYDEYLSLFNPDNTYLKVSRAIDYRPIIYYIYNRQEV
ncbi:hypothetical protein [Methanococcus sp. CF]